MTSKITETLLHIPVQILAGKLKMEFLPTNSLTKAFPLQIWATENDLVWLVSIKKLHLVLGSRSEQGRARRAQRSELYSKEGIIHLIPSAAFLKVLAGFPSRNLWAPRHPSCRLGERYLDIICLSKPILGVEGFPWAALQAPSYPMSITWKLLHQVLREAEQKTQEYTLQQSCLGPLVKYRRQFFS